MIIEDDLPVLLGIWGVLTLACLWLMKLLQPVPEVLKFDQAEEGCYMLLDHEFPQSRIVVKNGDGKIVGLIDNIPDVIGENYA